MISKISFTGKPSLVLCYKPELIENYDKAIADETQIWDCHHRLETHNSDGERRLVDLTRDELKALDMYYDRPPEELIFMTKAEHRKLHHKGNCYWAGKHHTEETKHKMSMSHTGKCRSEETRHKISMSHQGKMCKAVICIETGVVYPSIKEAERQTGINRICRVCKGYRKTAGGFHWMYETGSN